MPEKIKVLTYFLFGIGTAFLAMGAELLLSIILGLSIAGTMPEHTAKFVLAIITSALFAPAVEEVSKILPVILVEVDEYDSISYDKFMILALASAFGFSFIENILYGISFMSSFTELIALRFLMSTPMHLIATALTAHFYYKATTGEVNPIFVIAGMIVHGLFNGIAVLISW